MTATSTILIIDDEPNLRRSLALILQREGYVVTSAANAQEGLHLLTAGAYNLIFLDIKLPDRSGISILPEIRRIYPDMPVLILTAHASLETAIEAVRQGAKDYLLKPIEPANLIDRTRAVLAEHGSPQRRREITSQIQSLITELNQIERSEKPAKPADPVSVSDPARFLRRGSVTLDLHTQHVSLNEKTIALPPSTFDYLVTLVRHSPEPVNYQTLVRESQGYDITRSEARDIVRWQIHELRKVLEADPHRPSLIITVRDVGYRFIA